MAAAAGLEFAAIPAGKLRRYRDLKLRHRLIDVSTMALNARDLVRTVRGLAQSLTLVKRYDPDVVFIKGGYVGLPVGLAAGLLKVPYVIHESDIRAGLTNRVLSRWASAVAVGFPADKYSDLPSDKLVYTGSPIRQDVVRAHRLEGLARFQLDDKLPVVLITGGSQGSRAINDAVIAALPRLAKRYQMLHITGAKEIETVRFQTRHLQLEHPARYQAFSFLASDMGLALAAADVAVVRGGANTLAELAVLAKPAIVVPHPSLGDQVLNATALARQGAVKVITQSRLTPETLTSQLEQILDSEQEQRYLSQAIARLAVPDAATKLAQLILRWARPGEAK